MAQQVVSIPGRRVSNGETFYMEWMGRGGDCFILRAELLVFDGDGSVSVAAETRGEDGDTVTTVTATTSAIAMSSLGVATAVYLATTSTTPGNGAQEQVRIKIAYTNGSAGDYAVVRIFPPVFFDSAKPY